MVQTFDKEGLMVKFPLSCKANWVSLGWSLFPTLIYLPPRLVKGKKNSKGEREITYHVLTSWKKGGTNNWIERLSLIWGTLNIIYLNGVKIRKLRGWETLSFPQKPPFENVEWGGKASPLCRHHKGSLHKRKAQVGQQRAYWSRSLGFWCCWRGGPQWRSHGVLGTRRAGCLPSEAFKGFLSRLEHLPRFFFSPPTVLCCCSTPDFVRQDRVLAGSRAKRASWTPGRGNAAISRGGCG